MNKNWLTLVLISALAFGVTATAQAAKKTHSSSVKSVKSSKVSVVKPKLSAVKKPRKRTLHRSSTRPVAARAVSRTTLSLTKEMVSVPKLAHVSVSAAPFASGQVIANMAAASGASGVSYGQLYGLHHTQDPLDLKSSVALVIDQDTNEVVFSKNSDAVLPIASLTKLMTAMVMVEAKLPMNDTVTVATEDVDTEKNSTSRLTVGATLTRGELLHLALMSSENRAAHALGRTFPGGLAAFVSAMNTKARSLGMADTRYVDPTGLNSSNQSSARDLVSLVKAAYQQPLIRELSTSHEHAVRLGTRQVQFRNTNSLVRNPAWDIGLQKTGYIVEAGRCLVMQAQMSGRKFIMVFLDSTGKYSRQADAERVRRWIQTAPQKGALSGLPHVKVTS